MSMGCSSLPSNTQGFSTEAVYFSCGLEGGQTTAATAILLPLSTKNQYYYCLLLLSELVLSHVFHGSNKPDVIYVL